MRSTAKVCPVTGTGVNGRKTFSCAAAAIARLPPITRVSSRVRPSDVQTESTRTFGFEAVPAIDEPWLEKSERRTALKSLASDQSRASVRIQPWRAAAGAHRARDAGPQG